MDIADKARKLERRISRTVDAAVEEFMGRSATTPIEIVHAVLVRAETEIQEIGRGRRVFPFNRVRVHVVAERKRRENVHPRTLTHAFPKRSHMRKINADTEAAKMMLSVPTVPPARKKFGGRRGIPTRCMMRETNSTPPMM